MTFLIEKSSNSYKLNLKVTEKVDGLHNKAGHVIPLNVE